LFAPLPPLGMLSVPDWNTPRESNTPLVMTFLYGSSLAEANAASVSCVRVCDAK